MSRDRKKILMGLSVFLGVSLVVFMTVHFYPEGLKRFLEGSVNRNAKEFFQDSFRIGSCRLDRKLRIRLTEVEGRLYSEGGGVPLRIESVMSQGPATDYFSKEGLVLNFEGIRLAGSAREAARMKLRSRGGREGFSEFKLDVLGLDLAAFQPFSPEVLTGVSGEMKGEIVGRISPGEAAEIHLRLHMEEPGGRFQAEVLGPLLPYLPERAVRRSVREIIATRGLVGFQGAWLRLDEAGTDSMKVFLRILIPDYNLDLNLKIEVRVDEKDVLAQLVRLARLTPAR